MNYKELIERIVSRYTIPDTFSNESITEFVREQGSLPSIWGFCSRDISEKDLSAVSNEVLFNVSFNNKTVWGDTNYPYARIFGNMKNPGLGIKELHKKGIDGRGVNIAVIDKPILTTHSELASCLADNFFICDHERNEDYQFHGMTCASFACGDTTGTARGAKLYYYAYPDYFTDDNMYWDYYFKAFDMIIEHNNSHDYKINIVSVSAGVPNTKQELLKKLFTYADKMEKDNCYLIFSNNFGRTFTCASRVYGVDVDNIDCYKLDKWNSWDREHVLIPSGGRTSACNSGNNEFIYWGNQSCYSWAIPYVCGVFALAIQIKPDITYKDFCNLAIQSALLNSQDLRVLNPAGIIELLQ